MTGKEIEKMEKSLPRWENGKPPVRTAEQERLAKELSCRGMINSILIYHGPRAVQEGSYNYQTYLKQYEKVLGRETVAKLCEEQLADFQKAVVSFAGYDGEGVSYNSIKWADEMVDEVMSLAIQELNEHGSVGYTLPRGDYHIFIYLDDSMGKDSDEGYYYVVEPNRVVDGGMVPLGDTFTVDYLDFKGLRQGCDWCMEKFAQDRDSIAAVLRHGYARSGATVEARDTSKDFVK